MNLCFLIDIVLSYLCNSFQILPSLWFIRGDWHPLGNYITTDLKKIKPLNIGGRPCDVNFIRACKNYMDVLALLFTRAPQ